MPAHHHIELFVPAFYEGILDPGQWTQALQDLREELQATCFHQVEIEGTTVRTIAVSQDVPQATPVQVQAYEQHYAALDIRLPSIHSTPEGGLWLDHEHMPKQAITRSPIYTEFLANLGMRHTASLSLRDGVHSRDFLGLIRPVDMAPFSADERALLEQLVPHIGRANRLRHRTGALALQASLGTAALEAMPQAMVLVDAVCRVRYANGSARSSLDKLVSLGIQGGRLACSDASAQSALLHHVAKACGLTGPQQAGVLQLPTGGTPSHTRLHVLPLATTHVLATAHGNEPHALLVWTAPSSLVTHTEQLTVALGLTEAEARLALTLAQGQSVRDFADLQGCTWHTARTHAKNLLRKTGLHRQAEVIDLVRSLMWGG